MSTAKMRSQRAAVARDLDELARRDRDLARSATAVLALKLAEIVDDRENSAASRTAAARELREALAELRERAPVEIAGDGVSSLQEAARRKLARSAS